MAFIDSILHGKGEKKAVKIEERLLTDEEG